jgi:hypothetical protein
MCRTDGLEPNAREGDGIPTKRPRDLRLWPEATLSKKWLQSIRPNRIHADYDSCTSQRYSVWDRHPIPQSPGSVYLRGRRAGSCDVGRALAPSPRRARWSLLRVTNHMPVQNIDRRSGWRPRCNFFRRRLLRRGAMENPTRTKRQVFSLSDCRSGPLPFDYVLTCDQGTLSKPYWDSVQQVSGVRRSCDDCLFAHCCWRFR